MHSRFAIVSSLLAFGAGLAAAQSISLSSQCQSALVQVASSSDSSCLNVAGLAGLITTPANSSLVEPVNSWLSGACAQDPCSNDSLSAIATNITNGCSSDLQSAGINLDSGDVVSVVQEAYPTVRSVLCLKQTSNDTLCVTSQLTQIEEESGQTLSLDNIFSIWSSLLAGGVSDLPTDITCSDCTKQAYNVLRNDQPDIASNTTITDALTSQCGSSFVDGAEVSGVVEGTGSAAPTGTGDNLASSAAGLFSRAALTGVAVSTLVAISSTALVLA